MSEIVYEDECYEIQGAIFTVYRELGCGFLESVYQEALTKELTACEIPYVSQPELRISYKNEYLKQVYRPDFICYNKIIIELKSARALTQEHRAQVFNYLKVTGFHLGLLVNFGAYPKVEIVRVVK